MTLPASFPISASQINVELGRSAGTAFDIQGASERALAEVPSGAISMSDFLGKSFGPAFQNTYSDLSGGSSASIASVAFGSAIAAREIICSVHWETTGAARTLSSATIGGIAASITRQGGHSGGATGLGCAIIHANVPTGTSGTVALNFSGAIDGVQIGVWSHRRALSNLTSMAAETQGGVSASGSITVPSNGLFIAAGTGSTKAGGRSITVSPGTQRFNQNVLASGDTGNMGGSDGAGSGATTISLSTSCALSPTNCGVDLIAIAWNG